MVLLNRYIPQVTGTNTYKMPDGNGFLAAEYAIDKLLSSLNIAERSKTIILQDCSGFYYSMIYPLGKEIYHPPRSGECVVTSPYKCSMICPFMQAGYSFH